jgi:hypothetical protein
MGGGGGKKGGGGDTYYGDLLKLIGEGPIAKVHCIKVDSVTVWKDRNGLSITGEYVDISTDVGTLRIYKGSLTQPVDNFFTGGPAYRGVAYARGRSIKLGSERTSTPSVEIECTFGATDTGLVSPIAVLRELMCDPHHGLGADSSHFAADEGIEEETVALAPKLTDEKSLQDVCDELLPLVWCYARWEGMTLTVHRLYDPEDWDLSSIPVIPDELCLEPPATTPETPDERVAQTCVQWTQVYDDDAGDDTEGEYGNVSVHRDPYAPTVGGKSVTVQADAIITESHASRFAREKGHQLALSRTTGRRVIPYSAFPASATAFMRPIKVWDRVSQTWIRARVTSRTIAADGLSIELEWETDYASSIHDAAVAGYQPIVITSVGPVDPRAVRLVELPRCIVSAPAVGVLVARGAGQVNGYGIYLSVDGGANWAYTGNAKSFAVYGSLSASLSASGTGAVVSGITLDADLVSSVSADQAAKDTVLGWIGDEIVSIQTVTQGTGQITVSMLRGRCGTLAAAHAAGTPVWIIQRSGLPIVTDPITEPSPIVDTAQDPSAGQSYRARLPQRVALKTQIMDDCDDHTVSVNGLYRRPLPPAAALTSSATFDEAAITATAMARTWREAGYPGADFYNWWECAIIPVLTVNGTRTKLPTQYPVVPESVGFATLIAKLFHQDPDILVETELVPVSILPADYWQLLLPLVGDTFTLELCSSVAERASPTGTPLAITLPDDVLSLDGEALLIDGELLTLTD